jgi:hypothetical protein
VKADARLFLREALFVSGACAFCGLLLVLVSLLLKPAIDDRRDDEAADAFSAMAPGFTLGEKRRISATGPVLAAYGVFRSSGARMGWYAVLRGYGYAGDFTLGAWYGDDGSVKGASLLLDAETIDRSLKAGQLIKPFIGTGGSLPIPESKGELSASGIDAVSGATVTFTGIAKALASGAAYVRSLESGA